MPIHMTARYQIHPDKVEQTKDSILQLVKHVKLHEPFTTTYIALQEILNPSKFIHILRFDDETALTTHQNSAASAQFVKKVYPEALKPLEFMEYNLIATVNQ